MGTIAITCRNIKKTYGSNDNRIEALKGIDLDIYENQLTLLVGPSGSGKTTLLSIISTLLTPDEGDLILLGHEVNQMPETEKALFRRSQLGLVFQSLFLIPTLTIAENICLPLVIAGQEEKTILPKALELLKWLHLDHRAAYMPTSLSKGQQQRVAIARAIINDSKIIICDEPTSALDYHAALEVMSFLRELTTHPSRTVLVVTHDHRLFSFAHRVIYIDDGEVSLTENFHEPN